MNTLKTFTFWWNSLEACAFASLIWLFLTAPHEPIPTALAVVLLGSAISSVATAIKRLDNCA